MLSPVGELGKLAAGDNDWTRLVSFPSKSGDTVVVVHLHCLLATFGLVEGAARPVAARADAKNRDAFILNERSGYFKEKTRQFTGSGPYENQEEH